MVVWRLPCESKSSPAFKFKHPLRISRGGVFYFLFESNACCNIYLYLIILIFIEQNVEIKNKKMTEKYK